MKKIIFGIFTSFILVTNLFAANEVRTGKEVSCTTAQIQQGCNQCFESRTLRYGNGYTFFDNIHNGNGNSIYIEDAKIRFLKGSNIYNGTNSLGLNFTDWIVKKRGIIGSGESGTLVTTTEFLVENIPHQRQKDNIYIHYLTKYKNIINGVTQTEIKDHIECQPYEITWCGDGVLDPEETCDPNDPTKTGWGTGGCDERTCTPKVAPLECRALTATPKTGTNPTTSTFSCEGLNAPANATYKIEILSRGQVINTINSKTGTFNFTNPGTYTARCTINGNVTSPACEQVVTINERPLECRALTATPTTGEAPLNSTFSCEGLNAPANATYKIDILSRGQVISTINSKTGAYNFTNPGTYTAKCTINGNVTSPACEQVLTVKEQPKPESICENLEVSKLVVEKGQTSTFTCNGRNTDNYRIKIVNDRGLVVKEIFGKTGSYTFEQTGNYVASCYVDNKTTTEASCVKPISITEPIIPEIEVDKRDNNPADKDGNIGNDTQTVGEGEKAVFKITVTNNGTEELEEINLVDDVVESDVDAPQCNKSIAEINTILQAKFGRTSLKPGESFDYTCERPADAKDRDTYTNKITVDGKGKISLKKVKDDDTTVVNKSKDPKIKVDKRDNNPTDIDGNIGNDTQTIRESDKAIFKITVRNNGTEDLKNVFLSDDVLGTDVDAPNCDKSVDEVNNILKTIGNRDTIFNVGEVFDYTCERANHEKDTNPYVNLIKVTGVGVTSGKTVKDEDPTEVRKQTEEPKIKVDKTDKNPTDKDGRQENDTQTIAFPVGTKAIFKITVTNNGKEELKDINLKDDVIESTVDAPTCDKSVTEINNILQAKFGRTTLKPGESFDYTCERETVATDGSSYTNKITVDGTGVISLKKVKDEDPTKVNREPEPEKPAKCENIKVNKDARTFECKGTGTGYTVVFKDSTGKVLDRISNDKISGVFSGSYANLNLPNLKTVECLNAQETTAKSECTYTIPSTPTGTVSDRCEGMTPNGTVKVGNFPFTQEFKCTISRGNDYQLHIKNLDTGRGEYLTNKTGNFTYTFQNRGNYSVECTAGGLKNNNTGSCDFNIEPTGGTVSVTPPPKDYCGDGKVQRPSKNNPNGEGDRIIMEECDLGSKNGSNSWCSSECKVAGPLTFPGGSSFEFGPQGVNVIGLKMNPYTSYKDSLPYVENKNQTEGSIYVKQICITNKHKNPSAMRKVFATGHSFQDFTYCQNVERSLNPGEKITMTDTQELRKILANSISGNTEDNVLITTIVTGSESEQSVGGGVNNPVYQDSRFLSSADKFIARVSRGSVKTTGGGVTYVDKDNNGKIVATDVILADSGKTFDNKDRVITGGATSDNNKNFVGTSLTNFLTSYSKEINSTTSKNEVEKVKNETSNNNNNETLSSISPTGSFKEYNGITGAYIVNVKGKGNYKFEQKDLDLYSGPKTYIIENGNLTIDSNIIPKNGENIAFVVKGGNIIIKENVTNLNGTYIAIKIGENGGAIEGEQSGKQLVVSGSLYGNISKLTENRTYMKVNDGGQVDVGTVVSYGSSVFRKPAPLISTFVDEYVQSTKVAR